jgi:hypothetical protein
VVDFGQRGVSLLAWFVGAGEVVLGLLVVALDLVVVQACSLS